MGKFSIQIFKAITIVEQHFKKLSHYAQPFFCAIFMQKFEVTSSVQIIEAKQPRILDESPQIETMSSRHVSNKVSSHRREINKSIT